MGRPNKTHSALAAGNRMDDADFNALYADDDLNFYIEDRAGATAGRDDELSVYLRSEAWMRIATCEVGHPTSFYKQEARRAIDAAYKRHLRRRAASEDVMDVRPHGDALTESYNEAWAYHNGYNKDPRTPAAPGSDDVQLRGSAADDPIAWRERPPKRKRPWYER